MVGARTFAASDHILVLVYPNPLNPTRYVVINSGHTFSDADWRGTNANLFPHVGDYALMSIAARTVEHCGYFDEHWK